ncbi:MAG: BLUF domain-containing protein [Pseudomonadales bacterium]|nr:BLUF domain-containing protein [Pseudomonadales bacterium]
MSQLYELSYISEAAQPLTEAELIDLLKSAREKNEEEGITGILLYKEPIFMQVLEGPQEAVEATYERIKKDPRHGSVSGLLKSEIRERSFSDWAMGFATPKTSEIRKLEGFSDFLESSWTLKDLSSEPHMSHRLLLSFREQELG